MCSKKNRLLDIMRDRVEREKETGDFTYFNSLGLQMEYLTKIVIISVISLIVDEPDRHRYSLEHKIIHANSIGIWVDILNTALTGPPAQFFIPSSNNIARELTERVGPDDWRYNVVSDILKVATCFGVGYEIGHKVALRDFFQLVAGIRNRTRGHGATTTSECGMASPYLASSINRLINNSNLFKLSWAFLYRNMSGKYNVTPLNGNCNEFDYLKSSNTECYNNGVYMFLDSKPINIPLIYIESEFTDIFLPNGNYKLNNFESISYITNKIKEQNGLFWSKPSGRLPVSETEGSQSLEVIGNAFTNLPPKAKGYIKREKLEIKLKAEILQTNRHPIVTLSGSGGIGKTSLAISVIETIIKSDYSPFEVVLWLSARDIDLLDIGPKPVSPKVLTKEDIAKEAVKLLRPSLSSNKNSNQLEYFETCLNTGACGNTLFVFDNFETLQNPIDIFNWIDTHIRLPNKVLITTRIRDFRGDYHIKIMGMEDSEALNLIAEESKRLDISDILTKTYKNQLIHESDGHPYVIKILLGQIASEGKIVSPKRVVANSDYLLKALFERTFESLDPASRRIFLLLSSWSVYIPQLAVEAISLRPQNERIAVSQAIEKLSQFSLIEEVQSEKDQEIFVGVPLAAAIYGRSKLLVSPYRASINEDRNLLLEFGPSTQEATRYGVLPRVRALFTSISKKLMANKYPLDDVLPILEYLASRVPETYSELAELIICYDESKEGKDKAKRYLRNYLEKAQSLKKVYWQKLAELCYETEDELGELNAMCQDAVSSESSLDDISNITNKINSRIKELKDNKNDIVKNLEFQAMINQLIQEFEKYSVNFSAVECSRLAWLYLNMGNSERARDLAEKGVKLDSYDEHCNNLLKRLNDTYDW